MDSSSAADYGPLPMFLIGEPQATAALGGINLRNSAAFTRRDIVTAVLPLAEGTLSDAQAALRVVGAQTTSQTAQWEPMGARWLDGSIRYARMWFRADMDPGELRTITVERGTGESTPAFALSSNATALWPGQVAMTLTVQGNSVNMLTASTPVTTTEGRYCRVLRYRGRIPNTPVWYELKIQQNANLDHWRWWLDYGNSDPRVASPAYVLSSNVTLRIQGVGAVIRHSQSKTTGLTMTTDVDRTWTLIRGDYASQPLRNNFGDGAAQKIAGSLLFTRPTVPSGLTASTHAAEGVDIVRSIATPATLRASAAFGAFGYVPARPAWITSDAQAQQIARTKEERDYTNAQYSGEPWHAMVYGRAPLGSVAGAQPDFGCIQYWWIADSGEPQALRAAEASCYQEACGGYHHREVDVSRARLEDHPLLVIWQGRIFHRESQETFGKSRELAGNEAPHAGFGYPGGGWFNQPNDEHWSINHAALFALLTGDEGALDVMRDLNECFILMHRHDGVNATLSGVGAARRVGRMNHSGVQLWMALGDERTRFAITEKMAFTRTQLPGNHQAPYKPMVTNGPAQSQILVVHWRPWEDAQAVIGLRAVERIIGDANATSILSSILANQVLYGWRDFRTGSQYRWIELTSAGFTGTPGETVTSSSGGTAKLSAQHRGLSVLLFLHDVVGTFTAGDSLTFQTSGVTRTMRRNTEGREEYNCATAVGWNNGEILTAAQLLEAYQGPPFPTGQDDNSPFVNVLWDLPGLSAWSMAAPALGSVRLTGASQAAASAILAVNGGRVQPADGGYDDGLVRWLAITDVV